nr:putative cell-to-cell movement protein [Carrot umbravirus 2]
MAIESAATKEELINLLHGEVTHGELRELGLGVLTPTRGSNKLTCTPLYPPSRQRTVRDFFLRQWRTKRTGGMLFIEKLVVVFVPHVPDDAPGDVVLWLTDNALPGLDPVGSKIEVSLSGGPRLVAFYPTYSIPLSDSVGSAPRCFALVTQLSGLNLAAGSSAFSLFSMWNPTISEKAQHYKETEPECVSIVRHQVRSSLQTLDRQRQHLDAAMTNTLGRTERGSQSLRHPPLEFAPSRTQSVTRARIKSSGTSPSVAETASLE